MKYAIIKCVNGSYSIHAEGITDIANAKVQFHAICQNLWNAHDVITATVLITNENLGCEQGYIEFIRHETPQE